MSQSFSQTLVQQFRMEQRLTPQLIQSMAILQKPVAELEAYINDALETNAALELDEPEGPETEAKEDRQQHDPVGNEQQQEAGFARLSRFARQYDMEFNDRAPHIARRLASRAGDDPKMGALANTASREIGLNEHLLSQWTLVEVDEPIRQAGEAIINHLDPDGYVRVRFEQIAESVRPPLSLDALQAALTEVQRLDPCGIGARDVIECLLLQLDALPGDNQVERTLIRDHLNNIAHNRLPLVADATGYSVGEINEAIKAMRSTLSLHPGYLVGDRSVRPIRPDVIVEYAETGDGFDVGLTRGNLPKLRVSDEMASVAKSKVNGKEARDFAKKQLGAATVLIDAVRFRQHRLLEVAQAIVQKQHEFFNVGPEGLTVCRMSELAEELGCDPSTISRTVADKYMQTPRGIYPLRYFFTGGPETLDGERMGWDRVKTRVRELVDAEDRKKPLNDDRIAALLKSEGITISRRTVAKYRHQLDIPSARQRREY